MKEETKTIWIDLNEELYSFIFKKIQNEQIAKDIHSEVFFKIQTKVHQLKHTSKLTSWAYQITRNTILDHFRSINPKNIPIDDLDVIETEIADFKYANLSTCITQKIQKLSDKHKEAIILTSFQN